MILSDDAVAVVVAEVTAIYAAWRERRKYNPRAPEPSLTASLVAEHLRDGAIGGMRLRGLDDLIETRQRLVVHNALETAVRRGLLERSKGVGLRGREASVYAPK